DGRLDQPGLAQLPTQPGADRRHSGQGIRREDARSLRARPGGVRSGHTGGLAAATDHDACQGNVRSTLGVLAVSIPISTRVLGAACLALSAALLPNTASAQ